MQIYHRLVPDFIYDRYRAGEMRGSFQGASMFADLSGFSTMTDTLSQHGSHGAEVLAEMMRVVFEPLVNAVYAQGGFVIGYAGDAFNAVFPSEQVEGDIAKRCLASAMAIQSQVKSHSQISTAYGNFPIHIKVGIGFGETRWQIFKSVDDAHATYWFRGDSLTGAVAAEECCRPGDIVTDANLYALLKDTVHVSNVADCFLIKNVDADVLPEPLPVSPPMPADDLVGIFFPDSVARLPLAGEFRQAVNLFIDIPAGISDEALIAPFMQTVYLLQEQYGGYFLRPDLGDKGFNLLMIWGAPAAHENDVERALNFILELSARTRLSLRAGLSYRMAYAGFIGASQLEDYTAYGWGVNLAARLMEHAGPSEFWLDEEVARRAEKQFNLKFLDEYQFKGFKRKQKTFTLLGRKEVAETVYQGHLVGRKREMESLAAFIDPLKQGQFAGVMVLKGEAGIGKSRLVHTFQLSDYFHDQPTRWVVCQVDQILRLSFNPLKDWLKKRFQLLEDQSDEINLIAFSRNIQELVVATTDAELAAELMRTSSVLAALVNISQPGSLYESLDAKGRYDNTLTGLSVLFRAESLQKPLILFMEDTHWLDEDTGAFLSYFVRTLLAEPDKQYPIAIIATQRPEGDSVKIMDEVSMAGIRLGKLSTASMNQLAQEILGKPISSLLTKLLDDRADGNPFFAEQILRYLFENGALALDASGKYFANERAQTSMPTDVRAVLVARLDRLGQRVHETVQTASVLGREFEMRVLAEMLSSDDEFLQHVKQAEKANIWMPLTEMEYIFKHALLRDAAYFMQLTGRLKELHGFALAAMEVVYGNDLESHYPELAYHAEKADLKDKALHYLSMAGKLSLSVYQNTQAIDYFTRALTFVSPDDLRIKFDLLLLRAECHYNISNPTEQLKDLDVLDELAKMLTDDGLLARANMRRAYYFSGLGDFQGVLTYALQAKGLAEEMGDAETVLATYMVLPNAFLRVGKVDEAYQYARDALEFTRKNKTCSEEGRALTTLGLISLERDSPSVAMTHHEQALVIAREMKDRYLEAMALNNLANTVGLSQGDFSTARDYFDQAYSVFHELGNIKYKGGVLMNLGWVTGILGDYSKAIHYHEQALTLLREAGNQSLEMYAYFNLSASAVGQGLAQDAYQWAQKALELSTKLGDRTGDGWAYFCLGYAFLLKNETDEAIKAFLKSIEIRSEINTPILVVEARAGLLNAYLKTNDAVSEPAKLEAQHIVQYMDKDKSFEGAEEPLRIYLSLIRFLENTKDPRLTVVLQNAIQLLNAQVLKLRSEDARLMFIENVPWRRTIQEVAKTNGLLN
ncbi:MAG: tetratricopeptide repeat protein [Anaerolineales bacterium]|nr:tetratricopeptide repeat protein [Anaerolineales bacterium]